MRRHGIANPCHRVKWCLPICKPSRKRTHTPDRPSSARLQPSHHRASTGANGLEATLLTQMVTCPPKHAYDVFAVHFPSQEDPTTDHRRRRRRLLRPFLPRRKNGKNTSTTTTTTTTTKPARTTIRRRRKKYTRKNNAKTSPRPR